MRHGMARARVAQSRRDRALRLSLVTTLARSHKRGNTQARSTTQIHSHISAARPCLSVLIHGSCPAGALPSKWSRRLTLDHTATFRGRQKTWHIGLTTHRSEKGRSTVYGIRPDCASVLRSVMSQAAPVSHPPGTLPSRFLVSRQQRDDERLAALSIRVETSTKKTHTQTPHAPSLPRWFARAQGLGLEAYGRRHEWLCLL